MQFSILTLAFVLAAATTPASAQKIANAGPLTLAEAMNRAETANPAVLARKAQLTAASGARREAVALLYINPELSLEQTRRSAESPEERSNEWSAGISQPIEIGGQQSWRREAAAAAQNALRAEIAAVRRQVRAEAALRFHAVLVAQRRLLIEQRSVELFEATAQAVAKRRAAGEDTRLEANVALVEAERARNSLALAREQLLEARSELSTTLQLPPTALPKVEGKFGNPVVDTLPYVLNELLASANTLPRQRALAAREDAARARLGVERASRYPDITVGLNVGREGASDSRERVATLSFSVPLPLFKRNDAAIGRAVTDTTQSEVERATGMRDAQTQVYRLWGRLKSQRERVHRLQRAMVPTSIHNQKLAAKSRQAGQIGLLEQLIVNRQALDAERELNNALAEFHASRIELEHTAGWSQKGSSR